MAFLLFFAAAVGAEFRKVNFIAAGLGFWVLVSLYAAIVAL